MNKMTFDTRNKDELEKFRELVSFLVSYNTASFDNYNEIHIYQEDVFTIIEWDQVSYTFEFGGRFVFLDDDHVVLKLVRFPDNHIEYLSDENADKAVDEWLDENPGWVKNDWGIWTNELENKKLRDYLKDHTINFSDLADENVEAENESEVIPNA